MNPVRDKKMRAALTFAYCTVVGPLFGLALIVILTVISVILDWSQEPRTFSDAFIGVAGGVGGMLLLAPFGFGFAYALGGIQALLTGLLLGAFVWKKGTLPFWWLLVVSVPIALLATWILGWFFHRHSISLSWHGGSVLFHLAVAVGCWIAIRCLVLVEEPSS